jgi:hypothetical protein
VAKVNNTPVFRNSQQRANPPTSVARPGNILRQSHCNTRAAEHPNEANLPNLLVKRAPKHGVTFKDRAGSVVDKLPSHEMLAKLPPRSSVHMLLESEEELVEDAPTSHARAHRRIPSLNIRKGSWVCSISSICLTEPQRGRVVDVGAKSCKVKFEGHYVPIAVPISTLRVLPEILSTDKQRERLAPTFSLPHLE